jgi:uncharacterized protein (DUF58 family)
VPTASSYGSLLDSLRGLTWPARRPVPAGTAGAHHSRLRGIAPEFTEYRPYRQGDDPRRLDWKLLARADRAYLRLSDDRSTLRTLIAVDGSASMAFPQDTLAKWELACRLAMGLAAVAQARGDPVGLVVAWDDAARVIAPRSQRRVLGEIASVLERARPSGAMPLAPVVRGERWARRVVMVSDFLGDADALVSQARERVVDDVDVVAVHVVAREELDPPASALTAVDPEAAEVRRPLIEASRAEYLNALDTWQAALARSWREAGASYHYVVTDNEPATAIRRITAAGR